MLNFNDVFAQMMSGYAEPNAVVQVIPVDQKLEEFKQWAIGYVQEYSELEPHHPTLQQISNIGSVDEMEQILRQNHDYCDACFLKMYRRYAAGEEYNATCGCGENIS